MRTCDTTLAAIFLALLPSIVSAQPATDQLTPMQVSIGCAPPPALTIAASPLRVVGAQATISRGIYDERDLLVIDAGTEKGLQLGQQYYVRRPVLQGAARGGSRARSVRTTGWIRIVGVNETTAIASVDHVCSFVQAGDHLDAFTAPVAVEPVDVKRAGEPDFTALGRILFGQDEQMTSSAGDYVLIDRGADQGLTPGARLAIYRDVASPIRDDRGTPPIHLPLAPIGEAVVTTTSAGMAVVRIESARDVVFSGDFVVPRKP